jgi:hypothetical protein
VTRSEELTMQIQSHFDRRNEVQTMLIGSQNTPRVWVSSSFFVRCVTARKSSRLANPKKMSTALAPGVGCVTRSEELTIQIQSHFDRRNEVQTMLIGSQNTPRVWVRSSFFVRCVTARKSFGLATAKQMLTDRAAGGVATRTVRHVDSHATRTTSRLSTFTTCRWRARQNRVNAASYDPINCGHQTRKQGGTSTS